MKRHCNEAYIPPTNLVPGPYCKLLTAFFPVALHCIHVTLLVSVLIITIKKFWNLTGYQQWHTPLHVL